MELKSDCNRLYELRKICEKCKNYANSYFIDLDDSLNYDYKKQELISLNTLVSLLDDNSWNFIKNECCPDMCSYNKKRGWTQLFNKLNETKGYKYLLESGCEVVEFIPRSIREGIETPDLLGKIGLSIILCEVKTINQSDKEIERKEKGAVGEVETDLNSGLRSQIDKSILKAKSQLEAYKHDCVSKCIIYLVVKNDYWQSKAIIENKIIIYIDSLKLSDFQIEVEVI